MNNQDKKMISACTSESAISLFKEISCEHPLDSTIINLLKTLGSSIKDDDDDYEIFRHRDKTDHLWGLLLEKSIKCLRHYDTREPFSTNDSKSPRAYGIDDLKVYYNKYADFERILYGSSRYYRDHIIHVLRTWLSGIELLVKNSGAALDKIKIADKKIPITINVAEKISIWTIIALTHDLGYPLQKAKSIIDITQDMLSSFITNPNVSADFAFHGVQNYMNDFIVRLMSSKMEQRTSHINALSDATQNEYYVARLQSKYYFKFQKSLERNHHGILSTLIIYKLLTYFLESDYNINEDYVFSEEECRQFYIRREILRAIASHTCDDIYQMYMGSFAFLLRICDDTQEWGRKNISELYISSTQEYELQDIALVFNDGSANECKIIENITIPRQDNVPDLIARFYEQALVYVTIFRDGQDTTSRDFSFKRTLNIKQDKIFMELVLEIDRDTASKLNGKVTFTSDASKNEPYGPTFYSSLYDKLHVTVNHKLLDAYNMPASEKSPERWATCEFDIPLSV